MYLVGGAVRDALLKRPIHDMDFIMPEKALESARKVADALKGAYYALDQERQTGRVIIDHGDEDRLVMDFATWQGPDLESDLRARDFTINAMAMDLHSPEALIDPLGGARDLHARQLRACSPGALEADPVRILRGVRLATVFDLHIVAETQERMRDAVHLIPGVSIERLRDELFRIMDSPRPASAIRALDILGALQPVLPELSELQGVPQSRPHITDVWNHALDVLQRMAVVLDVLDPNPDPESSDSLHLGLMVVLIGRYREHIATHLRTQLNPNRSYRAVLNFAALYHDAGKPRSQQSDEDGRIRFLEHEKIGARIVGGRAKALHLSNLEIDRLKTIVGQHMRPIWLAHTGKTPSKRAIYRFFRDTGEAGVDICLLSLADVLATYGITLPQDVWANHLEVIRSLLEAWWERPRERVSPPLLLTGHDLISEFGMQPGPQIGQLLESLREAQVTDQIRTREQALDFVRNSLKGSN
ncbi:MAG TPA: HD domain-containing protein [Anaerolineales bacterium]|nr:HD domain-containing protein [Anaerolineales bacterium]